RTRMRQLPAGLAESLLADTSRAAVRRAGLLLLDEPDPVRRLPIVLRAAADPDPRLARRAVDAVLRTVREFQPQPGKSLLAEPVPLDVPPGRAHELLELAEAAAPRLPLRPRQALHELLAPTAPFTELLRVRHGLGYGTRSPLFVVEATFGARDPRETAARMREVMLAVLPYAAGPAAGWPADDAWPAILPDWFVARCTPEHPAPEDPAAEGPVVEGREPGWLDRWRGPRWRERGAGTGAGSAVDATAGWRLLDWVGLFDPEGGAGVRSWRWWDVECGSRTGRLRITVDGHPYGGGAALRWLVEAAGGHDVELP
ncbi:MAG: hypothetical protein HOY69_42585, partial [Streptomyces sp.]|nr:hypothetical protein [Streptomyces sp.]